MDRENTVGGGKLVNKIDFFKGFSGRLVSLTNLATNGNFASTSNWTSTGASFAVSGNEASYTANSAGDTLLQSLSVTLNRKYYGCGWVKAASGANITMGISDGAVNSVSTSYTGAGAYEFWSVILTAGRTSTGGITWAIVDNRSSAWTVVNTKYISVIDITTPWGSGNEPTKAQMDTLMLQFPERWLNGTQNAVYNW